MVLKMVFAFFLSFKNVYAYLITMFVRSLKEHLNS